MIETGSGCSALKERGIYKWTSPQLQLQTCCSLASLAVIPRSTAGQMSAICRQDFCQLSADYLPGQALLKSTNTVAYAHGCLLSFALCHSAHSANQYAQP